MTGVRELADGVSKIKKYKLRKSKAKVEWASEHQPRKVESMLHAKIRKFTAQYTKQKLLYVKISMCRD